MHKLAVCYVLQKCCSVGLERMIHAWNHHSIPRKWIPNSLAINNGTHPIHIFEIPTAVTALSEIDTKEVLLLIFLNLRRIHQEIMMCFYNAVSSFGWPLFQSYAVTIKPTPFMVWSQMIMHINMLPRLVLNYLTNLVYTYIIYMQQLKSPWAGHWHWQNKWWSLDVPKIRLTMSKKMPENTLPSTRLDFYLL